MSDSEESSAKASTIPADAVPLLTDDDDFTPQFEKALQCSFNRFDCSGNDKLEVDELHAFAQVCNGKPFPDEEIQEMRVS